MSALQLNDNSLFITKNFVGGEWLEAASGTTFAVTNPANNAVIARCPESTAEDVQKAIQAAEQALPAWKTKSGRERSRILRQWYDLVLHNEDDLATLITLENGKAASEAHGEVLFTASFLEWFSEEAARIYGDVIPATSPGNRISVIREPIGVCGMITPWNYPAGMITRKAGAALAAGCTAVIKTDGRTPLTGYALALLAERAGVPRGVINIITAWENTPIIGQTMCKSNTIRKISFTGSTRVGKILMEQSGKSLQKLSLELGGNAPVIVFDDANLELAVEGVLTSKFKSSGQTCVCANRIYIQDGIYDRFVSRLAQRVLGFKVGAGSDNSVTHGPLIEASAVAKSKEHVDDAVSKGARVLAGGKELPFLGPNFFDPTILTDCNSSMKLAHEETFGPVAALFRFSREDEVIQAANHTDVGLASYVFTSDVSRVHRVSDALHVGMVAINTGVMSDAPAPFGGVKHSGLGREGSKYGVEEYTELKTIMMGNVYGPGRANI